MFVLEGWITLGVSVVLLAVKAFAFVNAITFPGEAYTAGDKLTKPTWLVILGLGVVVQVLLLYSSPINLLHLIFTIAAFVYLADVRPKLAELTRR